MQLKNTLERYGAVSQLFHWLILFLIIGQFILVAIIDAMPSGAEKIQTIGLHKTIGMLILLLALFRLLWRWLNPVPVLPGNMKRYERWAAKAAHFLLYALIIAIPLSGWFMTSYFGKTVSMFGWFDFPVLVSMNKSAAHTVKEIHEVLAFMLVMLAIVHTVAALVHHFVKKDNVLRRMLPQ